SGSGSSRDTRRESMRFFALSVTVRLKPFDQAGIDQEPIEASRFGTARAGVEKSLAAFENFLLLGERGIERKTCGLQYNQWKIGTFDHVERRGQIVRFEIGRIDRVVGGEISRIVCHQTLRDRGFVERRLDDGGREIRLVVAIAHQQERFMREVALEMV